mgnify:CR=1 FL=1
MYGNSIYEWNSLIQCAFNVQSNLPLRKFVQGNEYNCGCGWEILQKETKISLIV